MDGIDRISAFHRFYTARIGMTGRRNPGSGLGVGAARILHEIGASGPVRARDLCRLLDLDEGYVSRLISEFTKQGLVIRSTDENDRRARNLALSERGRAVVADLSARSRAIVAARLDELPEGSADRLAAAMGTIQSILSPNAMDARIRDIGTGDAGWLVQQHAELYEREAGFDASFEPLVARILAGFLESRDPRCERAFIAEADGQRLGSIFCVRGDAPGAAKLRLFLLVPEARGIGLGRRLLHECLSFARASGYAQMRLTTYESHRAACALYARTGFAMTAARPVRAFGRDLVEQTWERPL